MIEDLYEKIVEEEKHRDKVLEVGNKKENNIIPLKEQDFPDEEIVPPEDQKDVRQLDDARHLLEDALGILNDLVTCLEDVEAILKGSSGNLIPYDMAGNLRYYVINQLSGGVSGNIEDKLSGYIDEMRDAIRFAGGETDYS